MIGTWQPTAKDDLYRRTGEVTWDCTACCLDGHEARAHDGRFSYFWDREGRVSILNADPYILLSADAVKDITLLPSRLCGRRRDDQPRFGRIEGDLLRLEGENQEGENQTVIYRLTKQPHNDRPSGCTPAVAELFPPYGDFYLAEWPD
jgi:hypothetical protein